MICVYAPDCTDFSNNGLGPVSPLSLSLIHICGCTKCHELEANVQAALASLGLDQSVELITDFSVIAAYGVMSTPALVVDGKVISYGKVLKRDEVVTILKRERGL